MMLCWGRDCFLSIYIPEDQPAFSPTRWIMSNLNGGTDMFGDEWTFNSCSDSFDLLSAGGDIWQLQHRTLSSNKVIHVSWGWGFAYNYITSWSCETCFPRLKYVKMFISETQRLFWDVTGFFFSTLIQSIKMHSVPLSGSTAASTSADWTCVNLSLLRSCNVLCFPCPKTFCCGACEVSPSWQL